MNSIFSVSWDCSGLGPGLGFGIDEFLSSFAAKSNLKMPIAFCRGLSGRCAKAVVDDRAGG